MDIKQILGDRLIDELKQVPSFDKEKPGSPILHFCHLSGLHIYYRRGDTKKGYQGNFIPVWFYRLLFDQVILFIRPDKTKERFRDYCGLYPEQLIEPIKDGWLIPLMGNDLNEYTEDVFGEFFRNFPPDRFLIRAQLFEDWLIGADKAFDAKAKELAEHYLDKYIDPTKRRYGESKVTEYKKAARRDTLIPFDEKRWTFEERLARFMAERALWQELAAKVLAEPEMSQNTELIKKSLERSPLEAYHVSRSLHYLAVPLFYSRDGFTGWARGEERHVASHLGAETAIYPSHVAEAGFKFMFPLERTHQEVQQTLQWLKAVDKDDLLGPARQALREALRQSQNIEEFTKAPFEKRGDYSKTWRKACKSLTKAVEKHVEKGTYTRSFYKHQRQTKMVNIAPLHQPDYQDQIGKCLETIHRPLDICMLAPMFALLLGLKHSPLRAEGHVIEREIGKFLEIPAVISDALTTAKVKLYFPKKIKNRPFILIDYPNPF